MSEANSKFSWSSVSQRVKLFSLSHKVVDFGFELKTILLTKLVEIFLDFFRGSLLTDSTNKNLPRLGFFALALWSCWLWIDLLTIKNMWPDRQNTLDWTWRGEGDESKASTSLNKALINWIKPILIQKYLYAHQSEWIFHNLNIINCPKLTKILLQMILVCLPG